MGDMSDGFKELTELRKNRHAKWKEDNTKVIAICEFTFTITNNGETILFRIPGKPMVDFYPSTGRWYLPNKGQVFSGGAHKFLDWFRECKEE